MKMSPPELYPLLFTPVLKPYVWGGRDLERLLGRVLPVDQNIAESWEIAAHNDGTTAVLNGTYEGMPLDQLYRVLGDQLVGTNKAWMNSRGKFPLLVKLLDAHQRLSVQVHPDDHFASKYEVDELGKSEMWVVLRASPQAAIILGLKKGVTKDLFRSAVERGDTEKWLHRLQVRQGDVICVPAGSLHAILGGALIAEIQQNSNTTYRIFDWNRVDSAGQARSLHVEQALEVINFDQIEPRIEYSELAWKADGICAYTLCQNDYFICERVEIQAGTSFKGVADGSTMEIWGVIEGDARVRGGTGQVDIYQVRFVLIPAGIGKFEVSAKTNLVCLRTYLPSPKP